MARLELTNKDGTRRLTVDDEGRVTARVATARGSREVVIERGRRPMVRTIGGATSAVDVVYDVRTAYDFMISLSDDAGSTDDLPAPDREWLKQARDGLPETARRDRESFLGNEAFLGALMVAVDRPEARDSKGLVAAVRQTDPKSLVRMLMIDTVHLPELTPLVEAAIEGDHSVLPRIEEVLKAKFQPEQCALRVDLLRQPEEYHRRLVGVLEAWQVRFAEVEERVGAMIRRDADDRAADRATLEPVDLIERTTGGIRWIPEPAVGRVILAPSYFARPYNYIFGGEGWRLFAYPLADSALEESDDPLAPPPAMVRLHRALGDVTRLRILKLLTERDLYMTEIANELGLSKPTIKHHLALLRSAGLLTVTEEGAVIYYSLRRDRLEEATNEIGGFLKA